jgi:hypothetical protein
MELKEENLASSSKQLPKDWNPKSEFPLSVPNNCQKIGTQRRKPRL